MTTTELPTGLRELLRHGQLPATALVAAAGHRDLTAALAARDQLPDAAVRRTFAGAFLPAVDDAIRLLARPLTVATVRQVLAREGRPRSLAALARHNVPDRASDRGHLLHTGETDVAAAVLDNPDWPTDEQFTLLADADGEVVLGWLAHVDVEVEVTDTQLLAGAPRDTGRRILDADPITCLRALARRPWLAQLPWRCLGLRLRSAAATISADRRVHYRAVGTARRLARTGRRLDAASLLEALACNPTVDIDVQRHVHRLARRLPCHYLDGWRPRRGDNRPLDQRDTAGQRDALQQLHTQAHARHRTAWSALLLTRNPNLAADVAADLAGYLDRHLEAAGLDPALVADAAHRLDLDAHTRRRWTATAEHTVWALAGYPNPAGLDPDDTDPTHTQSPAGPSVPPRQAATNATRLADCVDEGLAAAVGRRLGRTLGAQPAVWDTVWALLRDGWDRPLAQLETLLPLLLPTDLTEAA